VDRAVDATAAEQRAVGGVDDCVDGEGGDVGLERAHDTIIAPAPRSGSIRGSPGIMARPIRARREQSMAAKAKAANDSASERIDERIAQLERLAR
jgi:hypothetical protein